MLHVKLDTARICDWASLHDLFSEVFGFPETYARNMNCWIESMTALDDPKAGKSSIHVLPGEMVVLDLDDASGFALRCEDLYEAIIECGAVVNRLRLKSGRPPLLAFAYERSKS